MSMRRLFAARPLTGTAFHRTRPAVVDVCISRR
jgi:hypothetical protein